LRASIIGLLLLGACVRMRPMPVPLRVLDLAPGGVAHRTLIVLLPGRYDSPEDFSRHGFAELALRAGAAADILAVDAHPGYYLNRTVVERLREDILAPARPRYDRIWLVGISMGGSGALSYAAAHPEDVDGIVLLAPFLGSDALLSEIEKAGGLASWNPPPPNPAPPGLSMDDLERRMWDWLKGNEAAAGGRRIPVYLGWGEEDRFAKPNAMLGRSLPPERVFTAPGGHEWKAWTELWRRILASGALSRPPA
jgi:pimeloyl-ACP methyl ester carboxylesterase